MPLKYLVWELKGKQIAIKYYINPHLKATSKLLCNL